MDIYILIKPDAIKQNHVGEIIKYLVANGFFPYKTSILILTRKVVAKWNPQIFESQDVEALFRYYETPMIRVDLNTINSNPYSSLLELKKKLRKQYRNKEGNVIHTPNNEIEANFETKLQKKYLYPYNYISRKDDDLMRILIIGDSFVEGVGDDVSGGWSARLNQFGSYNVTSLGIGGDNTRDVLLRIPSSDRHKQHKWDLILVEVGLNDSRWRPSKSSNEVPINEFRENLKKIAKQLSFVGHTIVFLGLTRVNEKLAAPYKEDKYYINKEINIYDNAIKEISYKIGCEYIPVPHLAPKDELLSDGLHPSPAGHKLILASVLAYLG